MDEVKINADALGVRDCCLCCCHLSQSQVSADPEAAEGEAFLLGLELARNASDSTCIIESDSNLHHLGGSLTTFTVDRRAQRARLCVLEGRSNDPVDRQRASALWKTPVDRIGRPTERLLSVPVARSTERSTVAPTVGKMTVGGRPAGRPAVLTDPNG